MTEPAESPRDELLAFIRGDLTPDAERRLLARVRRDADLQRQLRCLQAAAGEALADHATRGDAEAFARLQARLAASSRPRPAREQASAWSTMAAWLRAHSLVLQSALAVLVIAQAVGLTAILSHRSPGEVTAPAMVRGSVSNCLTVSVRFKTGVREDQIGQWLVQYGATITAGPTAAGFYQIQLPDRRTLNGFVRDPQAQALAEAVQPAPGCNL